MRLFCGYRIQKGVPFVYILAAVAIVWLNASMNLRIVSRDGNVREVDVQIKTSSTPYAGVVTFCHGPKYEVMGKWSLRNHHEYANRHKYDIFQGDEHVLPYMHFLEPYAWIKPALFWQLLQLQSDHQWFIWADCDALYMNMDKPIPDLLKDLGIDSSAAGATHVVVSKDIDDSIFNTGVLLVKNSEWSRDFFANILIMGQHAHVRNHKWWEQFAMHELYKANMNEEQTHVVIVQERYKLNAFVKETLIDEYVEGISFVLHQISCSPELWEQCEYNTKMRVCEKLVKDYPVECMLEKIHK
jgi:hypothetical protein